MLSLRFASRQSTLVGRPVYQPWPSRMVRVWSVWRVMAKAISCYFLEKIRNCTDCPCMCIT